MLSIPRDWSSTQPLNHHSRPASDDISCVIGQG
jgi:hypothetical protein